VGKRTSYDPDKLNDEERLFLRSLRARMHNPDLPGPTAEEFARSERLLKSVEYDIRYV
jgi:hypothetical protein